MAVIDVVNELFTRKKDETAAEKTERMANAVGTGGGGAASSIGSTAGSIVGGLIGGAPGAAVGGSIGGWAGTAVDSARAVPQGPGTSMDSGGPASINTPGSESVMSEAQSLHRLAIQGLRQRSAADGKGKTY